MTPSLTVLEKTMSNFNRAKSFQSVRLLLDRSPRLRSRPDPQSFIHRKMASHSGLYKLLKHISKQPDIDLTTSFAIHLKRGHEL